MLSAVFAIAIAGSFTLAASAQISQRIKDSIVDKAADSFVSQIQSDSCTEFASMLKSKKSGSSSSSSKVGGMMKKDPAERERFVNKVAGPLLNKMIDCDLLPNQ